MYKSTFGWVTAPDSTGEHLAGLRGPRGRGARFEGDKRKGKEEGQGMNYPSSKNSL